VGGLFSIYCVTTVLPWVFPRGLEGPGGSKEVHERSARRGYEVEVGGGKDRWSGRCCDVESVERDRVVWGWVAWSCQGSFNLLLGDTRLTRPLAGRDGLMPLTCGEVMRLKLGK